MKHIQIIGFTILAVLFTPAHSFGHWQAGHVIAAQKDIASGNAAAGAQALAIDRRSIGVAMPKKRKST